MSEKYDAVVIGSGLGGLTAGALYARKGYRVLLLERNHDYGGAATVYQHGALTIEASLHETTDPHNTQDPNHKLFEELGILDDLEYIPIADFYEVRSKLLNKPFVLPHGMDVAKQALYGRFPEHQKSLKIFFDRITKTQEFLRLFADNHGALWWILSTPVLIVRFWSVFRNMRKSLAQILDNLFGDDESIKLALAANLAYYSDDPEKMWWFFFCIAQGSYLTIGGHYIKGGSKTLTDRLIKVIKEAGGKTMASRLVTRIMLDDRDRVCAVEHEARDGGDRQTVKTPTVFGNAAPHVLVNMLPTKVQSKFMQAYANNPLSLSLFSISLGLDRLPSEFGISNYSTFLIPDWASKLSDFRDGAGLLALPPGEKLPGMVIVDYSRLNTGLNKQPPYLLSIAGIDRLENWSSLSEQEYHSRRDLWLDAIIKRLDEEFPGIADAITQKEMTTALSMHRYLNTPGGALYGFAPVLPQHFSFKGLPRTPKTSVKGLWLASSYAGIGGFTGTMLSSTIAARMALRKV